MNFNIPVLIKDVRKWNEREFELKKSCKSSGIDYEKPVSYKYKVFIFFCIERV